MKIFSGSKNESKKLITCRGLIVLMMLVSLLYLIGCASVPTEQRFSLITPAKEILSNQRFVIVPTSVMQEYVPSGDVELDNYLKDNSEIWQPEIAAYLSKQFSEKGLKIEIVQVQPSEFKEKFDSLFRDRGIFNIVADKDPYKKLMSELASQFNATLVVPTLITKDVYAKGGFLLGSGSLTAKWDGVSRSAESGGSKTLAFFTGSMDVGRRGGAIVKAISLHVEVYGSKSLKFWSNGGLDVRTIIGVTKAKVKELGDIFKEKDYIKESTKVALEPLFAE